MCDPISMGMTLAGIQGVKTIAEISQQNKLAAAEGQAAANAALMDYQQLAERQTQLNQSAQLEQSERVLQAMRERSRIRVALGEAGVVGNSPLREFATNYITQQKDTGIMQTNLENRLAQTEAEKRKVQADAASRINHAKSLAVNPFMATLQIAGAGLTGYSGGYGIGKQISGK